MPLFCGGALALIFAMLAIYVDCYQAIRKNIWCVPNQFWKSKSLFMLSFACGLLATGAFCFASMNGSGWLDTLLGSKIESAYARGVFTGLAVLAIIRSKVLQIKDIDVGPEFIYSEGRLICLRGIRVNWASWRDQFIEKNLEFVFAKANFDGQLRELIKAAIPDADPEFKKSVESQIASVTNNRPQTVASKTDVSWVLYYRTLLNLALETSGRKPLLQAGLKA